MAKSAGAQARGFLVILTGDFAETEHPLSKDETLIGRNPTTDITLLDEGISREHALILRDEATSSFSIEDLPVDQWHQGQRQARAFRRAVAGRLDRGRPYALSFRAAKLNIGFSSRVGGGCAGRAAS